MREGDFPGEGVQFSWGAIFRGAIFLGGLFPGGIFPETEFLIFSSFYMYEVAQFLSVIFFQKCL